ncbi:MAG TPA: nucleotide disphospho-sugar-binding domain-containing protein, partial [Iamia sp.]|nr:nucleotide disphospho-sugar-binding domain-containing protein [Iamia sp.]
SRWITTAEALLDAGRRVLLVGCPRQLAADALGDRPDVRAVGFVPLSGILPRADLILHHGGLGTSLAAIRAQVPSLVMPLAYDQLHNARLLEAAGAGCPTTEATVRTDIARVARPEARRAVADLAARLIPVEDAVAAAVRVVEHPPGPR